MFAILFEVLLIEIQEEIRHFAGLGGGRSGYFLFFFARGRGNGGVRGARRGAGSLFFF